MNLPIHIARWQFSFILSFFMCHAAATLVILQQFAENVSNIPFT